MLAPDTVLQNRYLILRQLGEGGMGTIYQARDQRLGSVVVLKKTLGTKAYMLRAFEHEARLLANLRHARLPLVMDYFTEDDGHFLVMQFIPGKDLEELLQERQASGVGPFAPDEVIRWADQLLEALEYLHWHEPPIVHRDIKPQNLKRTPEGDVVLLDFGLAKGAAGDMAQVNKSLRGYTRAYASLEQIQGTGTDPRSDLYSLAATLYHLLTSESPPDAVTRATALVNGQPDPLRPANELNPRVSQPIAAVLHSAMAGNLNERPASATAMRQALQEAVAKSKATTVVESQPNSGITPATTGDLPSADPKDASALPLPPSRSRNWLTASFAVGRLKLFITIATGIMIVAGAATILPLFLNRSSNSSLSPAPTAPMTTAAAPNAPARAEVMRYYLELEAAGGGTTRVAGAEPLTTGQAFKLHFIPHERGYLYIVALNEKNLPTTFLTAQPHPKWQVKTNTVLAGEDFEFPSGEARLGLTGETPFTVIFSPEPLTKPDFLAQRATHVLTQPEQQEVEELRQKFGSKASEAMIETLSDQSIVTLPAKRGFSGPLVFDITLKAR